MLVPLLHGALHGSDLVILDETDGAYLLLRDAVSGSMIEGAGPSGARALLAQLGAQGEFAHASGALALHWTSVTPCARPLVLPQAIKPRFSDWAAFVWTAPGSILALWRCDLAQLLALTRRTRRPPSRGLPDEAALARRVAAFLHILAWAPWQGECLYRCCLLQRHLQALGFEAAWVFGVKTWPFQAHCWLQIGDLALIDAPERLAGFTPIAAV